MKPFYIEDNRRGIVLNLDTVDKMFLFEQIYTFRFAFGIDADLDVRPGDPSYARTAELYEQLCKEGGAGTDDAPPKRFEPGVFVRLIARGHPFTGSVLGLVARAPFSDVFERGEFLYVQHQDGTSGNWYKRSDLEVV